MQAVPYSDKAFLVIGDTKPWKEHLQALNGMYKPNWPKFPGHPGWMFSNKHEAEVNAIIQASNAGQIAPPVMASSQHTRAPLPVPIPRPLMNIVPAGIPPPASRSPNATLPPVFPTPVTVRPVTVQSVSFPSQFVAVDRLVYQMVLYTVPMPAMGQRVSLKFIVQDVDVEYTVSKVKDGSPMDDIEITRSVEDVSETSRAVVMGGLWQVVGLMESHSLTFH